MANDASPYGVIPASDVPGWDDEADVVIIGLGAGGASAAIEAAQAGAKVVALERASGGGGLTASAGGHLYMGGGTRVQKAVGIEDDVEDMYTYLRAVTPEPEDDKIRAYCDDSVSHFDWLVAQGVPFTDTMIKEKDVLQMTDECLIWSGNEEVWPYRDQAKPAPRGHKVAQEGEAGGAKLMEVLIAKAKELGTEVVVDAAAQKLVQDGDRIVGVQYKKDGADKTIKASKAVILASGHYTGDPEMLAKYTPKLADERITKQHTPFCDGSAHKMGAAAGGVLRHMDGALITSPFYPPQTLIFGVLVNKDGKRYVAEDSYHSCSSIKTTEQPDGIAYMIVDESIFDRPLYGGYEVVDVWESFEEMEKDLGMPAGNLVATMKTYNEGAEKGEDSEFHKSAKWMRPLEKPPFAALCANVGEGFWVGFALGGLKCDIDGRLLRADDSVIGGLYAVGACADNIAQDGTGYSSGTCIGESTYFGRRAGRSAAA
jgi:succinate dehydrogenase/fumarate reductase flavoprotein subunit